MKPLKIKNLILGEGIPKICVPIVGTSPEEIEAAALALSDVPADVVEWRADWLKGILDSEGKPGIKKAAAILSNLRRILAETVLLFTFRTFPEGGNLSISPDAYAALNLAVTASWLADLLDAELMQRHQIPNRVTSPLILDRQGLQVRDLRFDHLVQQSFDLCHMLYLLSKFRVGSIIAGVIRAG